MNFNENSSFCFIGDSITAAEKYSRIIVDYFVLHFPEKQIAFHSASVAGMGVSTILSHWDTLVGACKPTHATILFGMNDLQRSLYSDSINITDEILQKREAALSRYIENMKKACEKLEDTEYLVLTPTLHDENPAIDAPLYGGYDAALTRAGAMLKENFSPVLDLHAPLAAINRKRKEPIILCSDRVHPMNIGHAVIAYQILEALGFENPRLPLWDESFTEEEKAILKEFGILEDPAPKNPYSDARSLSAKRLNDLRYVELNVLEGQGIDIHDTEKADAFLRSQLTMPIGEWRIERYTEYMKNRHRKEEFYFDVIKAMENMYKYA